MTISTWTDEDTANAQRAWEEYRKSHNLSDRMGQTAGIDPKTGRVWFGESIPEIVAQRAAEGQNSPLRFERIGSETYYQKGGRR